MKFCGQMCKMEVDTRVSRASGNTVIVENLYMRRNHNK